MQCCICSQLDLAGEEEDGATLSRGIIKSGLQIKVMMRGCQPGLNMSLSAYISLKVLLCAGGCCSIAVLLHNSNWLRWCVCFQRGPEKHLSVHKERMWRSSWYINATYPRAGRECYESLCSIYWWLTVHWDDCTILLHASRVWLWQFHCCDDKGSFPKSPSHRRSILQQDNCPNAGEYCLLSQRSWVKYRSTLLQLCKSLVRTILPWTWRHKEGRGD